MFLNGQKILRARVFSWSEYLEVSRTNYSADWLSVLKSAMEIFNGDAKGFAHLPDLKDVREAKLAQYMRELIYTLIKIEADKNLKSVPYSSPLE